MVAKGVGAAGGGERNNDFKELSCLYRPAAPEMISVNGETSLGLVESCILRISISMWGKLSTVNLFFSDTLPWCLIIYFRKREIL